MKTNCMVKEQNYECFLRHLQEFHKTAENVKFCKSSVGRKRLTILRLCSHGHHCVSIMFLLLRDPEL